MRAFCNRATFASARDMQVQIQLAILALVLSFASCAHDLSETYSFKATLNTEADGGLYELYWTFDNVAETISFAVRVQTTGWVGFGISPNGQMPNSDVVIGWVTDDGHTIFHDRFARTRRPPKIDDQQDWTMKEGEEEDGFTILEFSRKYITCDDNDQPIVWETARVIWAFHTTDDPTSEELTFSLIHSEKGSASLNLLGGLPDDDPENLQYFDIAVDNITIPSKDTTYWCAAFRLRDREEIRAQKIYVTKFGPRVTEGNEAHVHHLVIHLCTSFNDTYIGNGGQCDDGVVNSECRGDRVIAVWAAGGEEFVFPDNVAFPFGGEDPHEYVILELHYDNPHEIKGTLDSSGMRIWYTSIPREHEAGILLIGYYVHPYMVIPPNAKNFTHTGLATEECTSKYFPEEGIHVFANILHTHLAGRGLTFQHLRYNPDCGVYEELEPIESNLKYDFDYQQINHLRHEVTILPGDILQVKCIYGTKDVDEVTVGGWGTREEMCGSFAVYYPKLDMSFALSMIAEDEYFKYLNTFTSGQKILAQEVEYVEGLNAHQWDEDERQRLQHTVDTSTQATFCGVDLEDFVYKETKFPEIGCSYIPPDQCSDTTPPTCCERIKDLEDAGVILRAPVIVLMVPYLLAIFG